MSASHHYRGSHSQLTPGAQKQFSSAPTFGLGIQTAVKPCHT